MSNVVAFKKAQNQTPKTKPSGAAKSMTLFIHIKRTTMIAHCGNLGGENTVRQDYVGKSLS